MFGKIIILVIFLILSAFFSSSESALFSLSKMYRKKLENAKGISKRLIPKLLRNPQQLLITILLGNTIVNITFASISVVIALQISENFNLISQSLAITIEILLVTGIILVFGEILPKTFAIQFAEKYSTIISVPIWTFKIVLFPIVKILEMIAYIFTYNKKYQLIDSELKVTTEDIKNIVKDTNPELIDIQKEEREMLNSAFEFSDTKVKEVMTPRVDVTAVEIEDGIETLINTIKQSGFSRIPIYRGNIDNIIGLVYSKDIILNLDVNTKNLSVEGQSTSIKPVSKMRIKDIIRSCYFIPENMKLSYLLSYFRKNKIHMTVVVDEYGGTSGLVTLEDVLEEIVGEILDETDVEKIDIKKINNNEYLLSGLADIDELNEKFGLEIDDRFDTFSGFIYDLFGEIPQQGEIKLFNEKFRFSIEKLDGQRIDSVNLKILKGSDS